MKCFCPVLGDNRSRKSIFGLIFEWPLKTGFTVLYTFIMLGKLAHVKIAGFAVQMASSRHFG